MTSEICFTEKEIGILRAESGGKGHFVNTLKVFGKKVDFVLTLVEYLSAEIFVNRTVAVGGIRHSGCKSRLIPVLDIIGFNCIDLVAVFDIGVNVGQKVECRWVLLYIVGESSSCIKLTFEIDHK